MGDLSEQDPLKSVSKTRVNENDDVFENAPEQSASQTPAKDQKLSQVGQMNTKTVIAKPIAKTEDLTGKIKEGVEKYRDMEEGEDTSLKTNFLKSIDHQKKEHNCFIDDTNYNMLKRLMEADEAPEFITELNVDNTKFSLLNPSDFLTDTEYVPQLMTSPCNKYTLYSAIVGSTEKPSSILYNNSDLTTLKTFSNYGHVSFIPESTIIVGVLQKDENITSISGEDMSVVAAYDIEKGIYISMARSQIQIYGQKDQEAMPIDESKPEDTQPKKQHQDISKNDQVYANYFSCYISELMFRAPINVNPLQDITGVAFGSTKIKNGKLQSWCGRMIFYYGLPRVFDRTTKCWKDTKVEPNDCEMEIDPFFGTLAEFAEGEDLTMFFICGGQQLVVYGLLADKIKKGITIYEVSFQLEKKDSKASKVIIKDIKISKRVNFPEEVAYQKDAIKLEFKPYDPMLTASLHVPTLKVIKNNSEYYMLDFRKKQARVVLRTAENEVGKIYCYGRKSKCLVGIKESKGIKIWIKKQLKFEDDSDAYVELFDIDYKDIVEAHMTSDLRQLWVDTKSPDSKVPRKVKVYQINLVNTPTITTHKSLKDVKYLTDGYKELHVYSDKAILYDLRADRPPSGQEPKGKENEKERNNQLPIVKTMKDMIGGETSQLLLQSISAKSDFKTFYFMFFEKIDNENINVLIYKINGDLTPVNKNVPFIETRGFNFEPKHSFMIGQYACIPVNQKDKENYLFFNSEEKEKTIEKFKKIGALSKSDLETKTFQFGLINDCVVYCDIKNTPDAKVGFRLCVINQNGNRFWVSVKEDHLALARLTQTFISNQLGNLSRVVVANKGCYAVIDLSVNPKEKGANSILKLEKVGLSTRPELSPTGAYLCYVDDSLRVRYLVLKDSREDDKGGKGNKVGIKEKGEKTEKGETGDKIKTIMTLERASNFDLRYIEEEVTDHPGTNSDYISSRLAILYTIESSLHCKIWCLDTNRCWYQFVADSPYLIETNPFPISEVMRCCYFNREVFKLTYFNPEKNSQVKVDYDLSYSSKNYSGVIMPVLVRSLMTVETEKDRLELIEKLKAYINLIHPNPYGEIKSMFLMLYNLDEMAVFKVFLDNIQSDMLFYECNLFEIFFGQSGANDSRQAIFDAASYEAANDTDSYVVNPEETRQFLTQNHENQMTNQLSRDMFKLLIQSQVDEKIICDLKDKQARSFRIEQSNEEEADFSIWKAIQNQKKSLQIRKAEDYTTYEVYRSLTKLDLGTGSHACTNFFQTMSKLADDDIVNSMLPLIYLKWSSTYWFALPFSLLYWTMAILAYIFLGFYPQIKALGVIVCILNLLFLIYEIKCASNLKVMNHMKDPWNWADLFVLVFCFSITIITLLVSHPDTRIMVWLRIIAATVVWIRAITWLRVFGPTRYLITMVFQVFIDMIPFLAIFIAATVGYTLIWRLSPLLEDPLPESTLEPASFYNSLYVPVMLIFGQGPGGETLRDTSTHNFSVLRFAINMGGNIVLSLCFLNFLIAIISGTFQRVDDKKDLHDVKELLNMIIEFNAFLENLMCRESKPAYYITLHPKITADQALQQLECKVDSLGEGLHKRLIELEDKLTDRIYTKFEKMDDQIKAMFKELTVQIKKDFAGKNHN